MICINLTVSSRSSKMALKLHSSGKNLYRKTKKKYSPKTLKKEQLMDSLRYGAKSGSSKKQVKNDITIDLRMQG